MNKKILIPFIVLLFLVVTIVTISIIKNNEIEKNEPITSEVLNINGQHQIKEFNPVTNGITIRNENGTEKFSANLNTPQENPVGVGHVKVAEFTIDSKEDYYNLIDGFEFYDLKQDSRKINKNFDVRYLDYEKEEVPTYKLDCTKEFANKTPMCENVESGTETIQVPKWKPFNNSIYNGQNLTIGLFTTTTEGEHIEWVPTINGVKISEWAGWIASLNTDLVAYYQMNETSGSTMKDSYDGYEGTYFGSLPTSAPGKAGSTGQDYDGTGDYSVMPSNWSFSDEASISLWLKSDTASGGDEKWFFQYANGEIYIRGTVNAGNGDDIFIQIGDGLGGIGVYSLTAYTHVVATYNTTEFRLYLNGTLVETDSSTSDITAGEPDGIYLFGTKSVGVKSFDGWLDELGVWNRSLTSTEVTELYNGGEGISINGSAPPPVPPPIPTLNITLISPENNSVYSTNKINFNTTYTVTNANLTNATVYVWESDGTSFGTNFTEVTGNESNSTYLSLSGFTAGTYIWNTFACETNTTSTICSFADQNNTFISGATLNSISYKNNTFETATEAFRANFNLSMGSEISQVQLIYNGTTYPVNEISQTATIISFNKTIQVPLNVNPLANQTNTFYFKFTYGGGSTQETPTYLQNASYINLQECDSSYTTQALNFTFFNEINQTYLDASTFPDTFEASWKYWLGNGDIQKGYAFQNLTSSFNSHQFCIFPYHPDNYTFKTDMDLDFSAVGFKENTYKLRNATLSNVSNDILLYLLTEGEANKFFLTFISGAGEINDALVSVQKYFTGLGEYQTVGILKTDEDGVATMWQQVDKTYKYYISQNGEALGSVERVSVCAAAPCTLTIQIKTEGTDIYDNYYKYYGSNVASTLNFNKTTKIVTYDFFDTTGLANYFRLEVTQSKLNESGKTICDSTSYSTVGVLTCNLTGYTGDFTAKTYVSRSPEKVDKVLGFIVSEDIIADLGLIGVFLIMGLMITIVFAAAVLSRGNPSTILFFLGISILTLKIIGIFPLSWVIVSTIELIIGYFIYQIRT